MMTMQDINCPACRNFRVILQNHVDAFKTLMSLNTKLSSTILINTLESLLKSSPQIEEPKEKEKNETVTSQSPIISNLQKEKGPEPEPLPLIVKEAEKNSNLPKEKIVNEVNEPLTWKRRRRRRGWKGWEKKSREIFQQIWSHVDADPFKYPVSPSDCPDYLEVIQKPMCLETVKSKLENQKYGGPLDFNGDILLIFQNSRFYNINTKSEIRRMTSRLESFYQSNSQRDEILKDWTSKKRNFNNKKVEKDNKTIQDKKGHNKLGQRRGQRISCRKCFMSFQNYDVLGAHASKCKGMLGHVEVTQKRQQGQRVKAAVVNANKLKLKGERGQKASLKLKRLSRKLEIRKGLKNKKNLANDRDLVIRNPFPGFNLKRAMRVKVRLERFRLKLNYLDNVRSCESPQVWENQENGNINLQDPQFDSSIYQDEEVDLHITPMVTPEVIGDTSQICMSEMILHQLNGGQLDNGSPVRATHELNWAEIESKQFYAEFDEGILNPINYTPLVPVQTDWDVEFMPNSNLIPLTPMTNISHEFFPNSFI